MMIKKRTVFLLGAGAASGWHNAPTTTSLTNFLKCAGPKNSKGEYITKYIYDYFKDKYTEELNFEGLIDIVEQCLQFWSANGKTPTINNLLLNRDDEFWENIIDYEYVEKSPQTRLTSSITRSKLNPQAKFFILLLASIYQGINSEIAKYGQFNSNTSKIDSPENTEINRLAKDYFTNLSKDNYLRIYSLNYDRVVQYLFHKAGLPAFQGFDSEDLTPKNYNDKNLVDSKRILTSFDENCIYHLHGNYAWGIMENNLLNIPDEIVNSYWGRVASNCPFSLMFMEKNKPLLQSNIISGFSKVQRTNLKPFKQMSSAFDIDCHTADEIIIIGYSFGDTHINETIRQAKMANPACKITCISPERDNFGRLLKNILWNNSQQPNNDFVDELNTRSSERYNCRIYFQKWREYLETFHSLC